MDQDLPRLMILQNALFKPTSKNTLSEVIVLLFEHIAD